MEKEGRNLGFTLIELVVVMAIIAVLGVILAPQYLRYVEKSKVTKDCHCAAEILEATSVAAMDEAVYKDITDDGVEVVWSAKDGVGTIKCAKLKPLETKVNDTIGDTTRSSKALMDGIWTIEVKQDQSSKSISCKGKWSGTDDDAKYTEMSGGTV